MCIYFGNSPELTYKNREHIFPASIGGTVMLPQSYVSDQANNMFSKWELDLMIDSPVLLRKMFSGPGSRGSTSSKKQSKQRILASNKQDGTPCLSFNQCGIPAIIPQILWGEAIRMTLPVCMEQEKEKQQFINQIANFSLTTRFVHIKHPSLSEQEMIVGIWYKQFFVATNDSMPTNQEIIKKTSMFLTPPKYSDEIHDSSRLSQSFTINIGQSEARVYGKIAMNALAYLKGIRYVQQPIFNEFRSGLFSEHIGTYVKPLEHFSHQQLIDLLPHESHWCIFQKLGSLLCCEVCLYGDLMHLVVLGNITENDTIWPDGYICDWHAKKEYTLVEYFQALHKAERPNI